MGTIQSNRPWKMVQSGCLTFSSRLYSFITGVSALCSVPCKQKPVGMWRTLQIWARALQLCVSWRNTMEKELAFWLHAKGLAIQQYLDYSWAFRSSAGCSMLQMHLFAWSLKSQVHGKILEGLRGKVAWGLRLCINQGLYGIGSVQSCTLTHNNVQSFLACYFIRTIALSSFWDKV